VPSVPIRKIINLNNKYLDSLSYYANIKKNNLVNNK